jgi:hypothetical protein
MKIEPMDVPKTREEFELRFHHLLHGVKSGRTHLGPSAENLMLLRKLPNGRLDFLSVNERARLNANSMFNLRNVFEKNSELIDLANEE